MGLLLFFFLVSIAFSFLCSILEAVLLSVTPSYVAQQTQAGTRTGKLLQRYKEDIDRPLSAILTLNTIAHTVGAIGVGAQAGHVFGKNYFHIGPLEVSYESIIATVMTLAILILSEIIPKTIGANNWRALSPFTVRSLRIMLWILAPFVWLSQLITKTMKKDKSKSVLSRADFVAMAQIGESSGAIDAQESTIINNLLHFEKQRVKDIMTPRVVAFMVQKDSTLKAFSEEEQSMVFSRIPVYGADKDDVLGMILKDELLQAIAAGHADKPIEKYIHPVKKVAADLPLPDLFDLLRKEKQHLFMVADEFGNVVGLVTMEDCFETLLGYEIVDESDKVVDLQALAKARKGENE